MRNRKIASAVIGIVAIGVISGLAGCGSTPAASPAASTSTSATAKPTPVKLTPAEVAANRKLAQEIREANARASAKAAAQAKAAAKKAAARAAAQAKAAAKKAAARAAAKAAAENAPISATKWGKVIRDPDSYTGDVYTISGTVSQYDINSNTIATVETAALVAIDANGNRFIVEAAPSLLGNVTSGQTFTAKVSVIGAVEVQSVQGGGTGQEPDFDALTFHVTG